MLEGLANKLELQSELAMNAGASMDWQRVLGGGVNPDYRPFPQTVVCLESRDQGGRQVGTPRTGSPAQVKSARGCSAGDF